VSGPLVLGLDVGTSSVKALVLDGDGAVRECRSAEHALVRGGSGGAGTVEAEPEGWWDAARCAIASLETPPSAVEAVGLTGNMSSVVLIDDSGAVLRPAPLLADARGGEQLAALDATLRAELADGSRNPVNVLSPLGTLLWLREHEPATLAAARTWLSAKDFLRLRLTGTVASDPTDAHNALVHDPVTRRWRADLIARAGLDPAIFPPLRDAAEVGGTVTEAAAHATGLAPGTPVAVGAADMAAAAIGAGATDGGALTISLGTSVTIIAALGAGPFEPAWHGKLTYHPLPRGAGGYALASLLTGGLALNWLRALAGEGAELPADVVPDPDDELVFVPQLAGTGTPDFEPRMRGSLLGLTPHTRAPEIAGALFEAIAFELAGVARLLGAERVTEVRATGGGANVDSWVQVIADVLEQPVERVAHADVSAIGAALLARRAIGAPLARERPAPPPGPRCHFEPRLALRDAWRTRAARYEEARALALDHYRRTSTAGGPIR
jgi:xylulokinase